MNFMLFVLNNGAIAKEKAKGFIPGKIDASKVQIDLYSGDKYHINGQYAVADTPANLAHFGGKGCAITVIPSNGKNGDMPLPLIMIDEYFKHLSPNAQRYMICHEFGHLINGDLNGLISAIRNNQPAPPPPQRSFVQECKADMNAVRLMGKDAVLDAMKECILTFQDVANVQEMAQRANYIKYNAD